MRSHMNRPTGAGQAQGTPSRDPDKEPPRRRRGRDSDQSLASRDLPAGWPSTRLCSMR